VKSICLFQDGDNLCAFVNTVMNILFPKNVGCFWLYVKISFLSNLLYITQSINTYIYPVCQDRLILRYCSCNTYLLHRRAELKAAPGSTFLMRNWTLGINEPLAMSTYITGVIPCCVKTSENNWSLFTGADCFVLRILSASIFNTIHHQSVIVK